MPLGVELSQEATYPIDPAAPVAVIHFVGLFTTTIFVLLCGFLEQPLPDGAPEKCSTEGADIEAKDHTNYLVTMMALVAVASVSYTFAYKGEYRRRRANRETTDNAGISNRES